MAHLVLFIGGRVRPAVNEAHKDDNPTLDIWSQWPMGLAQSAMAAMFKNGKGMLIFFETSLARCAI